MTDPVPSQRVVRVNLSPYTLRRWIRQGAVLRETVTQGIPADAECIGLHVDQHRNAVALLYTHPTFAEVAEGDIIPEFIVMRRDDAS